MTDPVGGTPRANSSLGSPNAALPSSIASVANATKAGSVNPKQSGPKRIHHVTPHGALLIKVVRQRMATKYFLEVDAWAKNHRYPEMAKAIASQIGLWVKEGEPSKLLRLAIDNDEYPPEKVMDLSGLLLPTNLQALDFTECYPRSISWPNIPSTLNHVYGYLPVIGEDMMFPRRPLPFTFPVPDKILESGLDIAELHNQLVEWNAKLKEWASQGNPTEDRNSTARLIKWYIERCMVIPAHFYHINGELAEVLKLPALVQECMNAIK